MADKRFLGLGFTFSATDKGLEQKLTNVSNVIKQISDNLDDVNKQFDKMTGTKTVNVKAKLPSSSSKPKSKSRSMGMADSGFGKELVNLGKMQVVRLNRSNKFLEMIAKKRSFSKIGMQSPRMVHPISADKTGKLSDIDSLSSNSQKWLDALGASLKMAGGNTEEFTRQLKDLEVSLDSTNSFTHSSAQKIINLGKSLLDPAKNADALSKQAKSLSVALHGVGEYFKDVAHSGNDFLKSLGLDFGKILPDQFKAAAKLGGSIIAGPFKGVAKLFSSITGKNKTEELMTKSNKFEEEQNRRLGRSSKRSVFTELEKLNAANKDEKKKGLFDSLKNLFTKPLALLAGLFGGLKALSLLPFSGLSKVFSGILSIFSKFRIAGGEAIAAVYVLSAAFTGLWKGLSESFGSLKNGMILLWQGVENLFEGVWALAKAIGGPIITSIGDWISKLAEGSSVVSFLVTAFTDLWKTIQKGWENIGELIGSLLGLLGDKLGGLFFGWGEKLKDMAKSFSSPSANAQAQPSNVLKMADYQKDLQKGFEGVGDKSDDLRASLLNGSKENLKSQQEQNEIQKETNQKMDQLIGIMGNTNKEMPTLNIMSSFDARKYGLKMRQDENDEVAAGNY